MARIERFEDIAAWQHARALTKAVYEQTQKGAFAKDFGLSGQIQRAAVSVMSNIAEGYESGSTAEYYRFLSIAKGSCAEVRSQLYVAHDVGYLESGQFKSLMAQGEETARVLGGLRTSIGKRRDEQRQKR